MRWIQLQENVAAQYPALMNSGAGYSYIENNITMYEFHVDAIPDDDNRKENNGRNVLADLIDAGYVATKSIRS